MKSQLGKRAEASNATGSWRWPGRNSQTRGAAIDLRISCKGAGGGIKRSPRFYESL
jgi:hypothetical protein